MKPRWRHRRTTFSIRSSGSLGAAVGGLGHRCRIPERILALTSLASSRPRTVSTARPPTRSTRPSSSSGRSRQSHGTPRRRAQREGERLEGALARGELLAPGLGRAPRLDGVDVALGRADVPPADAVAVRVRRRADAHVVALLPVEVVVAALVAGPGPVGDLLPGVAGGGEDRLGVLVAPGLRVVVGMAGRVAGERRAGLDRQPVGADVRRRVRRGRGRARAWRPSRRRSRAAAPKMRSRFQVANPAVVHRGGDRLGGVGHVAAARGRPGRGRGSTGGRTRRGSRRRAGRRRGARRRRPRDCTRR